MRRQLDTNITFTDWCATVPREAVLGMVRDPRPLPWQRIGKGRSQQHFLSVYFNIGMCCKIEKQTSTHEWDNHLQCNTTPAYMEKQAALQTRQQSPWQQWGGGINTRRVYPKHPPNRLSTQWLKKEMNHKQRLDLLTGKLAPLQEF